MAEQVGTKSAKAGDVVLEHVIIQSSAGIALDVTPQVSSIEYCEDIFQMFLTGQVVIQDNQNLTNVFPLIGNEIIKIKFYTPHTDESRTAIDMQFFITQCSGKVKINAITAVYILKFVSFEAIINSQTRISKTYRGLPHEIVADVFTSKAQGLTSERPLLCDQAVNNIAFISNWWKPDRIISYCCNHALNAYGNPSYVFFETRGGFVFTTLSTLCSSLHQPVQTFILTDTGKQPQQNQDSTVEINSDVEYKTIQDIQFCDEYDFFERSKSGFFGSETIAYDHYTNQYMHFQSGRLFQYDDHLNQYDPIPNKAFVSTNALLNYVPFANNTFDGFNQGINDSNALYVSARKQIIARMGTTKVTIKVHGKSEYMAGQMVALIVHKDQVSRDTDDSKLDKIHSGRYIIANIKHVVTPLKHYCNIGLVKDSYIFDPNKSAVDTSQKQ